MSRVRSGLSSRAEGPGGARGRGRAPAPRDLVQLCAFAVGDELYAVDIMRIKEIINPLPITRVPKAPAFVEGVIELRGTILPVVDLRKRFDLAPVPATRATKFFIVAIDPGQAPGQGQAQGHGSDVAGGAAAPADRWILGVVVDRVLEVIRIARDEIRATPAVAIDESARYFAGVCHHRDRIVMLVDIDAILTGTERLSLVGMSQSQPLAAPSLRQEMEAALGPGREAVRVRGPGRGSGSSGSSGPSRDGG